MKIVCPKCKHSWNYSGKSEFYITCPHCYRKIDIRKIIPRKIKSRKKKRKRKK